LEQAGEQPFSGSRSCTRTVVSVCPEGRQQMAARHLAEEQKRNSGITAGGSMQIENEMTTEVIGNPVVGVRLKLLGILEEAMNLTANSLTCDQRLEELDQWDSLSALDFVLAVEKLFGVTLEIDAVSKCDLVGQLVELVAN
jgi:acyl carrier protein